MAKTKTTPPKVFISYSHDSQEHKDRVLAFSDKLRGDGVDCDIDQYIHPWPTEGWPLWMERRIDWADFVLIVFTETYYRRAMGEEDPGKGRGTTWESVLIRNELYEISQENEKFIPVVFDANDAEHIIGPLKGFQHYVVTSPKGYEDLYRHLTSQPKTEKPITGPLKQLARKLRQGDFWGSIKFIAAPSFEISFPNVVALAKAQSKARSRGRQIENAYFAVGSDRSPRYQSIIFTDSQDGSGEMLDIEAVLSAWNVPTKPLFLVPHFSLDVIETLKAVSFKTPGLTSQIGCKQTQWIDGSAILTLDVERQKRTIGMTGEFGPKSWLLHGVLSEPELKESKFRVAFEQIAALPPTCFLLDFSKISLNTLFDASSKAEAGVAADWTRRAIQDFSAWIENKGLPHRLLVGMPRFFLAVKPFRDLVDQTHNSIPVFYAAQLFSDKYKRNLDYLEKLVQRKIPHNLESLSSSNSNTLIHEIAAFLLKHPDAKPESLEYEDLLVLAAELARSGFYEIAFRLELFCSTSALPRQLPKRAIHSMVSLDFDLKRRDTQGEQVSAIIAGVEKIPHALTRDDPQIGGRKLIAAMTGEAGAGKSVGLSVIQHWWSLPPLRVKDDYWETPSQPKRNASKYSANNSPPVRIEGKGCPAWLPIKLDLSDQENLDLNKVLQFALKNYSITLGANQNKAIDLIGRYAEFSTLRYFLNSPVMVLIDGSDSISVDQRKVVSRAIHDLIPADLGLIVALREVIGFPDDDLPGNEVRLRSMTRRQFEQLVENRLPQIATLQQKVKDLLHVIDKPLSQFIRTPYVLDKICGIIDGTPEVAGMNLYDLMQAYLDRVLLEHGGREHRGENIARMVYEWLPMIGFNLRKPGLAQQPLENAPYALPASQLGFIRSLDPPYQFEHELLCDFFAAKYLAGAIESNGAQALSDLVNLKPELWRDWEIVFRILAGLLWHKEKELLEETIEYLRKIEPRLALICLREFPREIVRRIPNSDQILNSIVDRIEEGAKSLFEQDVARCHEIANGIIDDAEALGFLDPRIADSQSDASMIVEKMVNLGSESDKKIKIGRYPVTNLEFAAFIADGGYHKERFWNGLPHAWKWRVGRNIRYPAFWDHLELNRPNYPVVGVSVYEAIAYCNWLTEKHEQKSLNKNHLVGVQYTFHLPTEKQWALAVGGEFAELTISTRAQLEKMLRENPPESLSPITSTMLQAMRDLADIKAKELYPLESIQWDLASYYESLRRSSSKPVGLFGNDKNGCFDMFGHVWQWCDDWVVIVDEDRLRMTGQRPSTTDHEIGFPVVVKGGPASDYAGGLSNVITGWFDPYARFHKTGFRICCSVVTNPED